jgi:hypothetical protein
VSVLDDPRGLDRDGLTWLERAAPEDAKASPEVVERLQVHIDNERAQRETAGVR